MATSDALSLLRTALTVSGPPILTTSADPNEAASQKTESITDATHLYFAYPTPPQCISLATPTRFISKTETPTAGSGPIDLRSIYFTWLQKDAAIPDYIAAASDLNALLPEGQQKVRNLVFGEKLDLLTWLEGAADTSDFITPLEDDAAGADGLGFGGVGGRDGLAAGGTTGGAADKAAVVAGGAGVATVGGTGIGVTQMAAGAAGAGARAVKVIDARLQVIYNGERRMGDHNTVLRGIKPTDFSHVRKHTETFLGRRKLPGQTSRPGQQLSSSSGYRSNALTSRPASGPQKSLSSGLMSSSGGSALSSKRSDPIILLSPSASSLLRMSNVKSFLDTGLYVPPDHPTLSSQTTANLLHITRTLRSLSEKPFRFIIVDSPEQFKPDYWSRVVAVFTTGQTWQFKSYKWREATELFNHVLGIYVGEKGLPVPGEVKGWASAVRTFVLDRWDEKYHGQVDYATRESRRWKDREVMEGVWAAIEGFMASKGAEWRR